MPKPSESARRERRRYYEAGAPYGWPNRRHRRLLSPMAALASLIWIGIIVGLVVSGWPR